MARSALIAILIYVFSRLGKHIMLITHTYTRLPPGNGIAISKGGLLAVGPSLRIKMEVQESHEHVTTPCHRSWVWSFQRFSVLCRPREAAPIGEEEAECDCGGFGGPIFPKEDNGSCIRCCQSFHQGCHPLLRSLDHAGLEKGIPSIFLIKVYVFPSLCTQFSPGLGGGASIAAAALVSPSAAPSCHT